MSILANERLKDPTPRESEIYCLHSFNTLALDPNLKGEVKNRVLVALDCFASKTFATFPINSQLPLNYLRILLANWPCPNSRAASAIIDESRLD